MIETALRARDKGLSVVPIEPGTKKAAVAWKKYQSSPMGEEEIRQTFTDSHWFAIISGAVSQNLELLDFDIPGKHKLKAGEQGIAPLYETFCNFLKEHGAEDLLNRLLKMQTKSGGMGLIYRCECEVEGNTKLAERWATKEELEENPRELRKVLIETRGEGGYFLTWPTPGYKILEGSWSSIPVISKEERDMLHAAARFLSEIEPDQHSYEHSVSMTRPGDHYNQEASWEEILTLHGWQRSRKAGGRWQWVRPGKNVREGISATTGNGPNDLLYIFSSSAYPFEPNKAYSKFAAFALLEHGGDYKLAAKTLAREGYGEQSKEVEDAIGRIVGKAEGKGLSLKQFKKDDFAYIKPTYLVDPYLPQGKCVLLDADGGTGKSCLCAAWSASLTSGREPLTGAPREPINVLYLHRGEDTDEEITTVFAANGGDFDNWYLFSDKSLQFDAQGLADLEVTIKENNIQLIVVDALFYFLSTLMENTYNALPAMAVMEKLNGIAERTRATFWNIRHTKKGSPDTKASDLGMGSVQFRNSHRGQLMLRFHPEEEGVIVCTDEKGSLLVRKGKPFCYRREELEIYYLPDLSNPFGAKKKESKQSQCEEWLSKQLTYGVYMASALVDQAQDLGISQSTLYAAAEAIGVSKIDEPRMPGDTREGRMPRWWAKPGYDWSRHDWGDPYA
jgi:hypothetical protein